MGQTCPACALCLARGAPRAELLLATHCFLQGPHGSPPDCSLCEEPLQEPGTEHTPSIYWVPTVCQGLCQGWVTQLETSRLGSYSPELTVLWSQDVLRVTGAIKGSSKCDYTPPGKASWRQQSDPRPGHGPSPTCLDASALYCHRTGSRDLTPRWPLRVLFRGASLQGRSKGKRGRGRCSFAARCLLMA